MITKFPPFLKGNPAEHHYLTTFNCNLAKLQCLTGIVKMCRISGSFLAALNF